MSVIFKPQRVYFERDALRYPLGEKLYALFKEAGTEIRYTTSHNRVTGLPGETAAQCFREAKRTLVVGVRRTLQFPGCRPSAHYQLPLATGCGGLCQYCYLHSTLGRRPYPRIYVNLEEILAAAGRHIRDRLPEFTVFEGSATSDPLAVEHYSGSLARAIAFFGGRENGYLRFATKQSAVEGLLGLAHRSKTRARFSINAAAVSRAYEAGVPPVGARVEAALKMRAAGYPVGFMIAPVFVYRGWEKEYRELLRQVAAAWQGDKAPTAGRQATDSAAGAPLKGSVTSTAVDTGTASSGSVTNAAARTDTAAGNHTRAPGGTPTDAPAGAQAGDAGDPAGTAGGFPGGRSAPAGARRPGIPAGVPEGGGGDSGILPVLTFEIIAHRFTARAKKNILQVFPDTDLPLDEGERRFKYGQFGYGKYIYGPQTYCQIEELFRETVAELFPEARIEYIV